MADPPPLLAIPVEMQLAICLQLVDCHTETSNPDAMACPSWEGALENFPALGSLAQTCKSLQDVVNPLLYERVKVSVDRPSSFLRLIRHFSRFGDRAVLVKELSIEGNTVPDVVMITEFAVSAVPVNFLLQEANRLGLQLPPGGVDLSDSLESLLIDVVLCQLPTIWKLVLTLPWTTAVVDELFASLKCRMIFHGGPTSELTALQYATRLPKTFVLSSLRHLEVQPPKRSQPAFKFLSKVHKESLRTLLHHTPALTYLRIGGREGERMRGIIQDALPDLKGIHLDDASCSDIAAIARFCPNLKRCHLSVDGCWDLQTHMWTLEVALMQQPGDTPARPEARSPYSMVDLWKLLFPLRSTLQELSVEWDKFPAPDVKHLAQLSRFRSLRSLGLVFSNWPEGDTAMFIDNLPAGIESLCVGGRGIPVYDVAVQLCKRFRERTFPNLKHFKHAPALHDKPGLGLESKVVKVFEGTGIDCTDELPDSEDA